MASRFNKYLITECYQSSKSAKLHESVFKKCLAATTSVCPKYIPGDHLLFFNPRHDQAHRDEDGYFSYQGPGDLIGRPLKRRMWTQGSINFIRPLENLHTYRCLETIRYVKNMGTTTFVNMERLVYESPMENTASTKFAKLDISSSNETNIVPDQICVRENRMLMYTDQSYQDVANSESLKNELHAYKSVGTDFQLDMKDIIAYSSMTNNPHKIHLDPAYCKREENLRDVIVQGPFTIQIMLMALAARLQLAVKSMKYKNRVPIFAQDSIRLVVDQGAQRIKLIRSHDCVVLSEATYELYVI